MILEESAIPKGHGRKLSGKKNGVANFSPERSENTTIFFKWLKSDAAWKKHRRDGVIALLGKNCNSACAQKEGKGDACFGQEEDEGNDPFHTMVVRSTRKREPGEKVGYARKDHVHTHFAVKELRLGIWGGKGKTLAFGKKGWGNQKRERCKY